MARLNANDSEDVKREKLRLDLEKFRIQEAYKTWRILGLGLLATVMVAITAWAVVRMTDKPAWLVLGLAIVSLFGGQTIWMTSIERRIHQLVARKRGDRRGDDAEDQS